MQTNCSSAYSTTFPGYFHDTLVKRLAPLVVEVQCPLLPVFVCRALLIFWRAKQVQVCVRITCAHPYRQCVLLRVPERELFHCQCCLLGVYVVLVRRQETTL